MSHVKKRILTEEEKWIVTAEHISKYIPECENLNDYSIDWSTLRDDTDCIPTIQRDI